jgi:glutaredoxin
MQQLILYTTEGCHLCDEAEDLLKQLKTVQQHELELVDISFSEELVSLYGIRIPVVRRTDNGKELGWPFDSAALLAFVT